MDQGLMQFLRNRVYDNTETVIENGNQITRRTIVCEIVKTPTDLQMEADKIDNQIMELENKKVDIQTQLQAINM